METVTDRDSIPRLDENQLIKTDLTLVTKVATPLLAVLTLGLGGLLTSSGIGKIPKFTDLPRQAQGPVGLGLLVMLSALVLSVAIIMSADLKARALVGAANLALRSRQPLILAPQGAAGSSIGLRVTRQGLGTDEEWLVVGAQTKDDRTMLLVARGDAVPTWIPASEVSGWAVS